MFSEIGVRKSFTNFTGKHLCWSLFFNKVATLLKRKSKAGFSCESPKTNPHVPDETRMNNQASYLVCTCLTILPLKNLYFTVISTKIHLNTRLAASDTFHVFTQSIKFFKFYYHTDD